MRHGEEFKNLLDPRDIVLEHDFEFKASIDTENIREKGFLKSGTYVSLI